MAVREDKVQRGCMKRDSRKRGPDFWQFRWSEISLASTTPRLMVWPLRPPAGNIARTQEQPLVLLQVTHRWQELFLTISEPRHRGKNSLQSSGSRYPGVLANRPPRACASSAAMSQAIHETGVSRSVTSSNDANTGPTWGSDIAAALKYRLCRRRLISWERSPETISTLQTAVAPRSAPALRTSTISEAFGRAITLRTFRVLENVATKRQPSSKRYQTAVRWMLPSAFSVPRVAI
jgi:hypothetical protein